jgi:ketosteroid isomerase-like protein
MNTTEHQSGGPSAQAALDEQAILAVEQAAFARLAKGDVEGFLEASDDEVDYFDPFLAERLDGLPALRTWYSQALAEIVDRWEMVRPRVRVSGDMGVLTFQFVSCSKGRETHWNTTEVYRKRQGRWKIVHSHWSLTKPELAKGV